MSQRSVSLSIAGQSLQLRTDEPDDVLRELVSLVTEHVAQVQNSTRSVPTAKAALLTALMLAKELKSARDERDHLRTLVTDRAHAALRQLDEHVPLGHQ